MATDAMVGNDIYLTVNTGTVSAPVWQQVAYQTDYTHDTTRDGIDVSHKGSDHVMTLPGREAGTITVSLRVLKPGSGDTTHSALRNAYRNRLPVYVQEVNTFPGATTADEDVYEAEGYILNFTKNGPDNDSATYDLEITLNEALTPAV